MISKKKKKGRCGGNWQKKDLSEVYMCYYTLMHTVIFILIYFLKHSTWRQIGPHLLVSGILDLRNKINLQHV